MRVTLTVKEGPHQGREFEFEEHDTFIVGRSARAQFRLPLKDASLSRVHFMVEVNPPHCRLTDLDSTNGTKVNGRKVSAGDLVDGDLIEAGQTVLLFSIRDEEVTAVLVRETEALGSDANINGASGLPPPTLEFDPASLPEVEEMVSKLGLPAPLLSTVIPSNDHSALRGRAEATTTSCSSCTTQLSLATTEPSMTPGVGGMPALCPDCLARARELPQPVSGYEVIRELGRGGMGVVYLAYSTTAERLVALKTIQPEVAAGPVQVERFLREQRILKELDHPHIVPFHEMGKTESLLFFSMEYVRVPMRGASGSNTAAPSPSGARSTGYASCSRPSTTPTPRVSSTVTSSRRICSWNRREIARPSSWPTSGSRAPTRPRPSAA
jgi:eukaryotic-like serine/threonine-protein kinase